MVSAEPGAFSTDARAFTLSGRVYHAVDVPAQARWWLSVKDAQGVEVRSFSGEETFRPGSPMQLVAHWDGKSTWGAPVKDTFPSLSDLGVDHLTKLIVGEEIQAACFT
ncbi:MAG: hypothetical protein ACXU86_13980 [Archangium sp.]